MLRFQISVAGEEVLDRAFNRIINKIEDLSDIWPEVATAFWEVEAEQFQSGGRGKWPELSPKYEEQKAKTHNFSPLMRKSDALYKSLTRKGADHQVYEANKTSLTIGSDLPYAKAHMKPYKKRPARPPIDLTDADKRKLVKAMQKPLVMFARAQGFIQTEIGEV